MKMYEIASEIENVVEPPDVPHLKFDYNKNIGYSDNLNVLTIQL